MALTKTVNFRSIQVEGAYIRVSLLTIIPCTGRMEFQVSYMASPSALPFDCSSSSCDYDLVGSNPQIQAYEHLKTLPEFEGATDC